MNLTWHIVEKDLRRMAVPVGAWIAFMALTTFVWARLPLQVDPHSLFVGEARLVSAATAWTIWMDRLALLLNWFHVAMGILLSAYFIHQDPLVGTTNFWSSRPISGGRLLRAKAIGGFLLFGALPVIVMGAVWMSFGFSPGDVTRIAASFCCLQLVFLVGAMAAASLTRNLGTFLFAVLGAICWLMILTVMARPAGGFPVGRTFSLGIVLMLAPLAVLITQFLAHRRRLGWPLYAAVLVLMSFAVFTGFPGAAYLGRRMHEAEVPAPASTPEDRGLSVRLGEVAGDGTLSIRPEVTGTSGPAVVPAVTGLSFVLPTKPYATRLGWSMGPEWGGPAALRVIDRQPVTAPVNWQFVVRRSETVPETARTKFRKAGVEISWMEPRVLWTVPLAIGAVPHAHEDTTQVVDAIGEDGSVVVLCREIDVRYGWAKWPNEGQVDDRWRNSLHADCYVVTDSETGERVIANRSDFAVVVLHGVGVTARTLKIPTDTPVSDVPAWLARHTLTKVRFYRVHAFQATFVEGALDAVLPVSTGSRP